MFVILMEVQIKWVRNSNRSFIREPYPFNCDLSASWSEGETDESHYF